MANRTRTVSAIRTLVTMLVIVAWIAVLALRFVPEPDSPTPPRVSFAFVDAVAISADDEYLAFGNSHGKLSIWSLRGQIKLSARKVHSSIISGIDISADGKLVVTGSQDRLVKLLDLPGGNKRTSLKGHEGWVKSVAFVAGSKVASAGWDGRLLVWDIDTGRHTHLLQDKEIEHVAYCRQSEMLACGDSIGNVFLLNEEYQQVARLDAHFAKIVYLRFSDDGMRLLSAGGDNVVKIWAVNNQMTLCRLTRGSDDPEERTIAVAASPDLRRVAMSFMDNKLGVWDLTVAEDIGSMMDCEHAHALTFSSDGRLLAAGTTGDKVLLFQIENLKRIAEFVSEDSP